MPARPELKYSTNPLNVLDLSPTTSRKSLGKKYSAKRHMRYFAVDETADKKTRKIN